MIYGIWSLLPPQQYKSKKQGLQSQESGACIKDKICSRQPHNPLTALTLLTL